MTALEMPAPETDPAAARPAAPSRAGGTAGRARRRVWPSRVGAAVFSVVLFAVCLSIYSRHNDFTLRYHPDEPSKAQQLMSRRDHRNFNHPLLLLEATELAIRRFDVPDDPQAIVETGRWVSAALGAGTAVALAWIGYAAAGLAGMLLVGAAVGLYPQLLIYSHYMKEDVALVFGLAITLLGSRLGWDARRWWTRLPALVLMGVGAGAAASAKYVGAAALGLALPAAMLLPRMRWHWRLVAPLLVTWCAIGTFLLINHHALDERRFADFTHAWQRETDHAISDHGGIALGRPNGWFIGLLGVETMPHARILAGVLVVCAIGTLLRRFKRGWDVLAIVFAAGYLAALSYSVIPFNRYFLPVGVMVQLFAGLGAAALLNLFGRQGPARLAAAGALLALIVGLQAPRCADFLDQLADDGRARLRQWVLHNVPAGSRILAETYAGLAGEGDHRPGQAVPLKRGVRLRIITAAPDAGEVSGLGRQGIDYVVIADTQYNRYFAPISFTNRPPGEIDRFRSWYRALDERCELVWSNQPAHRSFSFTNPTIKVYRVMGDE